MMKLMNKTNLICEHFSFVFLTLQNVVLFSLFIFFFMQPCEHEGVSWLIEIVKFI